MPELYPQRITNGTPAADGTPILVREYGLYRLGGLRRLCLFCTLPKKSIRAHREGIARVQCPHLRG